MRPYLAVAAFSLLCVACSAAQSERPVKFPILSADPYLVKTLLEGGNAPTPELSLLWLMRGMPRNTGAGGKGLLEGGHLMVNPTDNALWWIPDPKA